MLMFPNLYNVKFDNKIRPAFDNDKIKVSSILKLSAIKHFVI